MKKVFLVLFALVALAACLDGTEPSTTDIMDASYTDGGEPANLFDPQVWNIVTEGKEPVSRPIDPQVWNIVTEGKGTRSAYGTESCFIYGDVWACCNFYSCRVCYPRIGGCDIVRLPQ